MGLYHETKLGALCSGCVIVHRGMSIHVQVLLSLNWEDNKVLELLLQLNFNV